MNPPESVQTVSIQFRCSPSLTNPASSFNLFLKSLFTRVPARYTGTLKTNTTTMHTHTRRIDSINAQRVRELSFCKNLLARNTTNAIYTYCVSTCNSSVKNNSPGSSFGRAPYENKSPRVKLAERRGGTEGKLVDTMNSCVFFFFRTTRIKSLFIKRTYYYTSFVLPPRLIYHIFPVST